MAVDREFVLRALKRIVDEEEAAIFRELSRVDSTFIRAGHGGGSSPCVLERHRVTEAEVNRAATRIMNEVRKLAGREAPTLAEDAGLWVGHLTHRLLTQYREQNIMGLTREQLAAALVAIREKVVDDLQNRPIPPSNASAPVGGVNINSINAPGGNVAVGGRDAIQHVEDIDVGGLMAVLLQVRLAIDAASISPEHRESLIDDISAMEAVAQQPSPDIGRLLRLAKRLVVGLKDVALPVIAGVVEACVKMGLGLP